MKDYFKEIVELLNHFLTPAVKIILLLNSASLILFGIVYAVSIPAHFKLLLIAAQTPALSIGKGFVWQFASFNFVHYDFNHFLCNMLSLCFFGPQLERRWGTRRFWLFYMITGAGAGLCHAAVSLMFGSPHQMIVGASGAIYGVLLAFAAYFPDLSILFMFIYPIKAKYLILLIGIIDFMSSEYQSGSNISHLTHLSGLVVAYLWLSIHHREWDIRRWRWTRGH